MKSLVFQPESFVRMVTAPHPAATIAWKLVEKARTAPGVRAVLISDDLGNPGKLPSGERLLAGGAIEYAGQPVALIVADSPAQAADAEALFDIQYHPAPAVMEIDHALAMQHFLAEPVTIARGDFSAAMALAPGRIEGSLDIGTQLPLAGPPPGIVARPLPDGRVAVELATEFPDQARAAVAAALGESECRIEIRPSPLPGLSGSHQTESAHFAALTALAAQKTGRCVAFHPTGEQEAALGARRHALRASFTVGFDASGRLLAVEIRIALDGGYQPGESDAILDRVLLHADGAYFVPDIRISGRLCRTNRRAGGTLPGEGAAQGALIMEEIVARVAHSLTTTPETIRAANLYREEGNRHSTPYGQPVDTASLHRVWNHAVQVGEFEQRQQEIVQWNLGNAGTKRGIALVPVKFGLGDPRSERNQALASLQWLRDGSVLAWLGCADAGDGLAEPISAEIASQLGLPRDRIQVHCGHLPATPHFTARIGPDTAALMRRAVANACEKLKKRVKPIAAQLLTGFGAPEVDPETVRFDGGTISSGVDPFKQVPIAAMIESAWQRRENLAATGFHRTPNLWWDREIGAGWPFSGFVCGAAAIEVSLDAFTGRVTVLRADIVHQGSGESGCESLEKSQISRALQMGLGWLMHETGSSGVPAFGDMALRQQIELLPHPLHHAAASGAESAVFLAVAAREAIREALRAFGTPVDPRIEINLPVPATPAAVLESLREIGSQLA